MYFTLSPMLLTLVLWLILALSYHFLGQETCLRETIAVRNLGGRDQVLRKAYLRLITSPYLVRHI